MGFSIGSSALRTTGRFQVSKDRLLTPFGGNGGKNKETGNQGICTNCMAPLFVHYFASKVRITRRKKGTNLRRTIYIMHVILKKATF